MAPGIEPLQEWPRVHNKARPAQAAPSAVKRVGVAGGSIMHLYQADPTYERAKSSTESDAQAARRAALKDAIRALASGSSAEHHAPTDEIRLEDVLGLEQLVLEHPLRVRKRRKFHVRAVLREQAVQRHEGVRDDGHLALVSALLSERSAAAARGRATILRGESPR